MVAGRSRIDAALAFGVVELQQLVERAAFLEGRGELLVFRLDPQLGMRRSAQTLRKRTRRAHDMARYTQGGGFDIGKGNAHALSLAEP